VDFDDAKVSLGDYFFRKYQRGISKRSRNKHKIIDTPNKKASYYVNLWNMGKYT